MTAIASNQPEPRYRPEPPADPARRAASGQPDTIASLPDGPSGSFAALLASMFRPQIAGEGPEAFEAAGMVVGADRVRGGNDALAPENEGRRELDRSALRPSPDAQASKAPGALLSGNSILGPLDPPTPHTAPLRGLSGPVSALQPSLPAAASPVHARIAQAIASPAKTAATRMEAAAPPRMVAAGQTSRFAVLLVAGEDGPLMVLRLPRLSEAARQELELRAAEMAASLGKRPIRIAIQEVGGD